MALQYNQQATRFLDGIFSSLSNDLRTRERYGSDPHSSTSRNPDDPPDLTTLVQPTASSSSKQAPAVRDPIHMLRALASAEAPQATEEALAAAASAPPAHLGQSTSATPRRPGVTPTSRRALGAGTTPRRPGGPTATQGSEQS
jgi:kinetochore protein Mis13/DSN1